MPAGRNAYVVHHSQRQCSNNVHQAITPVLKNRACASRGNLAAVKRAQQVRNEANSKRGESNVDIKYKDAIRETRDMRRLKT